MSKKDKFAHEIRLSVFHNEKKDSCKEEDLKRALGLLSFTDIEEENIPLVEHDATGVLENKIKIYTLNLKNNRHIRNFIDRFFSRLDEKQLDLLKEQLESRLDDGLNFFVRLDKKDLLEDRFTITDSGDCFHIKINLAVFPAKREKAKDKIEKLLNRDMEI